MTEELLKRLDSYRPLNEWGQEEHHFIVDEAAALIRQLKAENERMRDKAEGLDSDLRSAVQAAYNRGAKNWARLNYPQWVEWLEASAAQSLNQRREG